MKLTWAMLAIGLFISSGCRVGGEAFHPVVSFLRGEDVLVPPSSFEFHEYAFGNVEEYFEGERAPGSSHDEDDQGS